jgi:ADP-ribose pyrophosphatase YjhB (NUDIX family)
VETALLRGRRFGLCGANVWLINANKVDCRLSPNRGRATFFSNCCRTMTAPSPIVFGTCPPGVVCRDRPAAYAIIHHPDGCVAAVCAKIRGREEFWLPGGGMYAGETPEQTVVREVREELGREVRLHWQLGQAVQFFFAGDEDCWYKMTASFIVAEFHGEAEGRGEHHLHWVDPALRGADFFHACHVWAALQTAR